MKISLSELTRRWWVETQSNRDMITYDDDDDDDDDDDEVGLS
jgi:hypothetical protein